MKTIRFALFVAGYMFFGSGYAQLPPMYGCTDPAYWNYNGIYGVIEDGSCAEALECPDGEIFVVWRFQHTYTAIRTGLLTLVTDDLQDTLFSQEMNGLSPILGTCIDPTACYRAFYIPDSIPDFLEQVNGGGVIEPYTWDGESLSQVLRQVEPWMNSHNMFAFHRLDGNGFAATWNFEGVDCGRYGCQDSLALNYDPEATIPYECVYCNGNRIFSQITEEYGTTPEWSIRDSDDSYVPRRFGNYCLSDGCYELVISNPGGGGQSGTFKKVQLYDADATLLATAMRSTNQEVRKPFVLGPGACSFDMESYGCRNPNATNYSPESAVYDGSCDFDNGLCGIEIQINPHPFLPDALVIQPFISSTAYPLGIYYSLGDSTVYLEHFTSFNSVFDEPVQVCMKLQVMSSLSHFSPHLYCESEICMWVDPSEYGLSGGEFQLGFSEPILSSSDLDGQRTVQIFPNPTDGYVRIEAIGQNASSITSASLCDLSGRVIESWQLQPSNGSWELSLSDFASGVYLLRIESGGQYETQRLVVY